MIRAMLALLLSICAGAATAGWSVSMTGGPPGSSVEALVSFSGDGSTVEAQADLVYPGALVPTPSPRSGGACQVRPGGRVRVLTAGSGISPLSGDVAYCSIAFFIPPETPSPTVFTLAFTGALCGNSLASAIPCPTTAGSITAVNPVATSTTLSAAPESPVLANTAVTMTANVSGAQPSGTVAFTSDLGTIPGCGAVSLSGSGDTRSASCIATLAVGDRTVTAQFSGDFANFASSSAPVSLTVLAPTIAITPDALPSATAGTAYATSVSASGAGSAAPFTYSVVIGSLPPGLNLQPNGSIGGTPSLVVDATFTIRATDSSPASVGGPFFTEKQYVLSVAAIATTTSILGINPTSPNVAQPYTVTVSVTSGQGVPSGTVSVGDGAGASCVATLSGGIGQCQMASSAAGTRTVTATYPGQGSYGASSGTASLTVVGNTQAEAIVAVPDRIGLRDRTVTVPITIRGEGTTVRFSARLAFDPAQFQSVELRPIAPATCTRIAPNLVEVSTLGSTRTLPLPQIDTPFCDIAFRLVTTPLASIDLSIDPQATACRDAAASIAPCRTRDGKILVSALVTQPPDGTQINIAGYQGQPSETRVLVFSNVGTAPVSVTNCTVSGTGFSLVSAPPTPIAPATSSRMLVGCTLAPLPETRAGGLLQCATSDAVRSTLSFGLACTTVAQGSQLPEDQIFNNALKQGDEFGRATAVSDVGGSAAAAAPSAKGTASNTQLMVVGAPNAGSDSAGRIFIFEGDLTPKALRSAKQEATPGGLASRIALDTLHLSRVLGPPRVRAKIGIGDKFGSSVAISPTGSRIVAGVPLGGANDRGQVLVYDRPTAGWADLDVDDFVVTIEAPPPDGFVSAQEFGATIAFTPAGDLVVGAPGTDSISSDNIGAVYFYEQAGAGYGATPQRTGSPNAVANGRFGAAVAANDEMIVIGAPQEGAANSSAGAAYVLPLENGLPTSPTRFIAATTGIGDKFGSSVAVGSNGMVVVGASGDDIVGVDSGSATVFRPNPGIGAPIEVTTLVPEAGASQGAGTSVATNGELIVVGAPLAAIDGEVRQGRAYVFEVEPQFATATNLPARTRIDLLRNSDGEAGAEFGQAVAINRSIAVAGVPLDDRLIDNVNASDVGRADPFALERIFRSDFE